MRIAAAAVLAAAGGLSACEPSPMCGAVITVDTTLAADVVGCAGDGIIIGADGVTLDLAGHTVGGASEDREPGAGTVGIRVAGHDDVTVVGGLVHGFETGVGAADAHRVTVREVRVDGGRVGVRFDRVAGSRIEGSAVDLAYDGYLLIDSSGNTIDRSSASGDPDTGSAIWMRSSNHNTVVNGRFGGGANSNIVLSDSHDNLIADNAAGNSNNDGISLGRSHRNRILRNFTGSEIYGISLGESDDTVIDGNDNGWTGIDIGSGSDRTRVTRNLAREILIAASAGSVVTYNTVTNAWSDGISVDAASPGTRLTSNLVTGSEDDGIDVEHPGTVITGNVASGNRGRGIEAIAGVTDGGRNRASDNHERPQCVNVRCT